MKVRKAKTEQDLPAIGRIWQEVGWIGDSKDEQEALQYFLDGSSALVAEVNGEVEGFVNSTPGQLSYQGEDMPMQGVTAVTMSRLIRKKGLAGRLTAKSIASAADDGMLVSYLGMFEQGFYNRLGYGTGGYEHRVSFDPAQLMVNIKPRIPRRISKEDWQEAHQCRVGRKKKHGFCTLLPPGITRAEMAWTKRSFGLGYYDGPGGELSHFIWGSAEDSSHGPYNLYCMVYNNGEQFLELMALLKSLGEQVFTVRMHEPAGIQLQDLLKKPFRERKVREKTRFQSHNRASAYWQLRILDLAGCLARTSLDRGEIEFNLELTDPIEAYLEPDSRWKGLSGCYQIRLGETCAARSGYQPALPLLQASVGAFSRMWLGVAPASSLAITDSLQGPVELLQQLDSLFCLPHPMVDWDF
ncbi:MAG: GNAT family N-acetyltransferase [Halanaerobium sp.]|nr:GNAT family N-acetyltransferase [Halanaerobium sp.]